MKKDIQIVMAEADDRWCWKIMIDGRLEEESSIQYRTPEAAFRDALRSYNFFYERV